MYKLRDYQIEIADKANIILKKYNLVYLSVQVRCGKSLMALETCKLQNANKVLFITKIKAFSSVLSDYKNFNYKFDITVINKESLSKIKENDFDIIIIDEAHQYGAFPKAGKFQKEIRKRFSSKKMIFLSGTPTPESYSQIYHQLQLSNYTPFKEHTTFYKWAYEYVNIKKKYLGYAEVNDYTDANKNLINEKIKHLFITFTQEQSGFTSKVNEYIINVQMSDQTYWLFNKLKKDLVVIGKNGTVTADTGAKLMQKLHQIGSGTIKIDDGSVCVFDDTKCKVIEEQFKGQKLAIFYKFKAELQMLKDYFKDLITDDLNEFNNSDKWIALQFISGREGVNLSKADSLVMFNIDFSATTYFQAKDRLTTIDRKENNVYWLFGNKTIDSYIYKAVTNKKNFTHSYYVKNTK